jgi:hypothetical protein
MIELPTRIAKITIFNPQGAISAEAIINIMYMPRNFERYQIVMKDFS